MPKTKEARSAELVRAWSMVGVLAVSGWLCALGLLLWYGVIPPPFSVPPSVQLTLIFGSPMLALFCPREWGEAALTI